MPKPPPRFKKPEALELFTDRVSEQDVLRRVLAPASPLADASVRLVTSFYGVGGVGKTTLCHQALANASREHPGGPIRVHTSFDDHRWTASSSFASVALELCQILSKARIPTELTAALLLIWDKSAGEAGRVEETWQLAVEAVDKVAEAARIPGVSLLVKSYMYLRNQSRRAEVRQRMHELDLWPAEVHGRATQLEVERKLPLSLFHDVQAWLNAEPGRELRMLLDGFERIQGKEDRQDGQRGLQEFIGYFAIPDHERTQASRDRFRVVIFGREKLRWDELYHDEEWNTYWSQHLLGGLAESDALIFLDKAAEWRHRNGRPDVADAIRTRREDILDAADEQPHDTRAFYPYSLDLAVDVIDRTGGAAVDLGRTPAELQERFLRYLDAREKRALMILAMAEVFDEEFFDWLATHKLVDYPVHSFRTEIVTGRSYLQEIVGQSNEWRFHRKMEEALQKAWLASAASREEGRRIIDDVLEHHRQRIAGKPPRDWGPEELQAWSRGMEIIVTQGPELALLGVDEWTALIGQEPWSAEHYLLFKDRTAFLSRIARVCEATFGERDEVTCRALFREAVHLQEAGHHAEAETLHRRVLDVRRDLLGRQHRDTLVSLNTVARLLADHGHFAEAEPLCRSAVADCTAFLGETDPETLRAHHNLGVLLADLGYLSDAEAAYTVALRGREATLGADHLDTLKTMNNLGQVLRERNRLEAAETMFRTALATKEATLGPDHPSTLKTASNLADLLAMRGDFDGAESLHRRVVAGFTAAYGASHPTAAAAISEMASLLHQRGKLRDAYDLCDAAIAERTPLLGDDHLTIAVLRQTKARLLAGMHMGREALPLFEQVLASLTTSLGPTHHRTLDALDDLAGVLAERGQFARAEILYHQAVEGLAGTRGAAHPETLACRTRLAKVLASGAARLAEAEAILGDVLTLRERALGPMHRDTLDAMDDLAGLLAHLGRHSQAEELYLRAAGGLTAVLGAEHLDTLTCRRRLALMYQQGTGEFGKAEAIFQDVLRAATATRGALHPYTLDVLDDLAGLYAEQGDYGRAEEYYDRAASGLAAPLGPDHPQTLACRLRLARMLVQGPERYDEAETIVRDVWTRSERVLGPAHPLTLDTIDDLAALCAERGDHARSQEYYDLAAKGLSASLGADHPQTIACRLRLGRMLQCGPERYDEAEAIFRDVLARHDGTLGPAHPRTLDVIDDLAGLYGARGDHARAEEHYERAAEGLASTLGIDHPQTLACRLRLAMLLAREPDRSARAEALLRDLLARQDRTVGPTNPGTRKTFEILASLLRGTGRLAESLALRREWYARGPACAAAIRYNLACDECAAGNLDEARRLMAEEIGQRPDRRHLAMADDNLVAIRDFIAGA